VLDFFAGSGTTGDAAARLGRRFVLIDNNPDAIQIMVQRLAFADPEVVKMEMEIDLPNTPANQQFSLMEDI